MAVLECVDQYPSKYTRFRRSLHDVSSQHLRRNLKVFEHILSYVKFTSITSCGRKHPAYLCTTAANINGCGSFDSRFVIKSWRNTRNSSSRHSDVVKVIAVTSTAEITSLVYSVISTTLRGLGRWKSISTPLTFPELDDN